MIAVPPHTKQYEIPFCETPTAYNLLHRQEQLGIKLSDYVLDQIMNEGGYRLGLGNAYSVIGRIVCGQLTGFDSDFQITNDLAPTCGDDPTDLLVSLAQQISLNPQVPDNVIENKEHHSGNCSDAEMNWVQALSSSVCHGDRERIENDFGRFIKKHIGDRTMLNLMPIEIGGITVPVGCIFDDLGIIHGNDLALFRPSPFCFSEDIGRLTFGHQLARAEYPKHNGKIGDIHRAFEEFSTLAEL